MENDFECIKIKDGLYLSNLATAQDGQFLQINKFAYVVNCSAETPNHFEAHGIKYLKFKLLRDKPHKLWDENTKKLQKLQRFIEEAEENALCCLVFSAQGNNRSLVMLVALLMSKFRWTMGKALQYVRSKNVFIGLSEHYISQLEALQEILTADETKPIMTYGWKGPYSSEEEEIVARTFLNSQQIIYTRDCSKMEKKLKRVVWQDKLDKQKKKQGRSRGVDISIEKKAKKALVKVEEGVVGTKSMKKTSEEPFKKPVNIKKSLKVAETSKMQKELQEGEEEDVVDSSHKQNEPSMGIGTDINFFNQKELIRLIKKNLKIKKETAPIEKDVSKNNMSNHSNLGIQGQQVPAEKEIYQLTINNFIQPNINIMNGQDRASQHGRFLKDKVNRALSEKQKPEQKVVKMGKPKSIQKKTEGSPRRERRLEKTHSLQFRKNV